MTTQQFFKGMFMALMTVVVAAFSQSPVDYPLLVVTLVSVLLTYIGKNIVGVLHSDSPAGALSWINLLSGLLIALGTAVLEGFGTYVIEGVVMWDIVWKVALSAAFTYLGGTFFAPPYSTEKVRIFGSVKKVA